MTHEQLFNLLRFYRKAIVRELDQYTLEKEIFNARKELDHKFTMTGIEDESMTCYINELLTIQSSLS